MLVVWERESVLSRWTDVSRGGPKKDKENIRRDMTTQEDGESGAIEN